MNAEQFLHYIKNPAHLYQITYTELKSLVLQYPYCQNLRNLLLKKSILEKHKDHQKNLHLAATYSADRNLLYHQIKSGTSYESEEDAFILKEDFMELKELNPSQQDQAIPPEDTQESPSSSIIEITGQEASPIDEPDVPDLEEAEEAVPTFFEGEGDLDIEDITVEMELEDLFKNPEHPEEENENVITFDELMELESQSKKSRLKEVLPAKKKSRTKASPERIEAPKKESKKAQEEMESSMFHFEEKPAPTPKSAFESWVQQFQSEEKLESKSSTLKKEMAKEANKAKKSKRKKPKKHSNVTKKKDKTKKPQTIASKSLLLQADVVSQTLAELLVEQGSFDKAIQMFERLSLIFPEKSIYFAAQIEKIKKEL